MSLARSRVEKILGAFDLIIGDLAPVRFLRKESPDKTSGVFIGSAFSGTVRMSKKYFQTEIVLNFSPLQVLLAPVARERLQNRLRQS